MYNYFIFCDASAYYIGYIAPEYIAVRVMVNGRGGAILQPAVDIPEQSRDFPKDRPIIIITDAGIENDLRIYHEHGAFMN